MVTLKEILAETKHKRYAVGSFSPRYSKMILPVIEAAIQQKSPVIVQISEKEIIRHKVNLSDFSAEFRSVMERLRPQVPVVLHLDHTKTMSVIEEAVRQGFASVMIDASEHDFEQNVDITGKVVAYARKHGVSVEAELGKIGTTDFVETDTNEEVFTDPQEARRFCELTGIDALAPSVGTAHGLYTTQKPTIRYDYLEQINRLTDVPLVLHGASGVPADMVIRAVQMETGGVAKVNIATDLEQEVLKVLGKKTHMTEAEMDAVSPAELEKCREAVHRITIDKISNYLLSANMA